VVLVAVREVEKKVVRVEAGKEAALIEVLQVVVLQAVMVLFVEAGMEVVLQVGVVQKQRDQSYED